MEMQDNGEKEAPKRSGAKKMKIAGATMALTLIGVSGFGAYWYNQTDNALNDVPRADLMPDQSKDNALKPDPNMTIEESEKSSSPKPTASLNSIDKKLQKSALSGTTKAAPRETLSPAPTGGANTQRKNSESSAAVDEVDIKKTYSKNPNKVGNVSTTLNPITGAKNPPGVDTYLLIGTDSRNPAKQRGRSDSLMLAYVNKNHDKVYLISFPRDLYVAPPGYAKQKINAAYNYGGAPLTVKTIERFTGSKVNHAALVNFNSFVGMVDSVGGVTVYNPYTGCDNHQHLCWKKGPLTLNSWDALHYVRWRHGLPNGDITRSQNQQRVVKAVLAKTITPSNLANPKKFSEIINKTGKNVVLDRSLTNETILKKVLGMRISGGNDIRTITAPIAGYYMDPRYGSVDLVNAPRMQELRRALATDTLENYWNKYKNAPVAGAATRY